MMLISGPVVFTYDQILVLPEAAAKAHNQILVKNKLKALDKNNQETNFFANRKERKHFHFKTLLFLCYMGKFFQNRDLWQYPLVYSTELSVIKKYQKAKFSQE